MPHPQRPHTIQRILLRTLFLTALCDLQALTVACVFERVDRHHPTHTPSLSPTHSPTFLPTREPTHTPSHRPSHVPSPSPTQEPTQLPSFRPSHAPTLSPSATPLDHTPSPVPTFPYMCFSDSFDSFDSDVWESQCSGCSYSDGSLLVTGTDQLMVTNEPCPVLERIDGELVKSDTCSDHIVMVSPSNSIR